jgi:hypothetical protein
VANASTARALVTALRLIALLLFAEDRCLRLDASCDRTFLDALGRIRQARRPG